MEDLWMALEQTKDFATAERPPPSRSEPTNAKCCTDLLLRRLTILVEKDCELAARSC
jgi:hypothetical protein